MPTSTPPRTTLKPANWLLIAWAAALFIGSLAPIGLKNFLGTEHHSTRHRYSHLLVFACGGLMVSLLLRSPWRRFIGLIALVLFGAIIELLEYLLYHAPFELSDLKDDSLGACLGLVFGLLLSFLALLPRKSQLAHQPAARPTHSD